MFEKLLRGRYVVVVVVSVVVLVFDCRQLRRVGGEGGEDHPLLVVRPAEHLVVVEEELVPDTEPVATLLASEALQMIDVGPGSHHHLEGGDHFITGGAVASGAKQAEVVSLAEQEVPLGVERVAHLPQPGVTAAALEAVLVPVEVHGLQGGIQEARGYWYQP